MSEKENRLLADFLNKSMAKQRKKVAIAERIKDGVVYAIYKVQPRGDDKTSMDLVVPGELCIHKNGEELPQEVRNIPRLAFSTLFCLGDLVE